MAESQDTQDTQGISSQRTQSQQESSQGTAPHQPIGTDKDRRPVSTGAIGNDIKHMLREQSSTQFDQQKQRATDSLGSVAGAVRSATQQLRDAGQPGIADYANRAAESIEQWSSKLRDQNLDDTIHQVQQFARQRPMTFIGVAFGLGVLAARFLKSSGDDAMTSSNRFQGSYERDTPMWPAGQGRSPGSHARSIAHDVSAVDVRVDREVF